MSVQSDRIYVLKGEASSQQAQASSANPGAGKVDMRILVELQLLSFILKQGFGITEDLTQMRQDIADSM